MLKILALWDFERTIETCGDKLKINIILQTIHQITQRLTQLGLCIYVACFITSNAFANCSRPINVPIPALNATHNSLADGSKRGDFSTHVMQLMDALGGKLGCQFTYLMVPKARQELLFRNGEADVLFMATRSEKRDEVGQLIPLLQIRPVIISNIKDKLPILSVKEIKENPKIQLVLVRGFDYGREYQELISSVNPKRVSYEADAFSVARMMNYKKNVVTIMGPSIFEEVLKTETILKPLVGNIQYEAIEEFSWLDVGIYISNFSLEDKDFIFLKQHLPMLTTNERIWAWLNNQYSKDIIKISFRQVSVNSKK